MVVVVVAVYVVLSFDLKIEFGFWSFKMAVCLNWRVYVETIPGTIPIQLDSARCGDMMGDLYMFYVVDTTQLWAKTQNQNEHVLSSITMNNP